mmetsp:Transcript_21855/g.25024  ORF Transcript_21855/g.25024 Transcript_21855/m.25024 type:complete len:117 (-) Transcript_21855:398-748(-)
MVCLESFEDHGGLFVCFEFVAGLVPRVQVFVATLEDDGSIVPRGNCLLVPLVADAVRKDQDGTGEATAFADRSDAPFHQISVHQFAHRDESYDGVVGVWCCFGQNGGRGRRRRFLL